MIPGVIDYLWRKPEEVVVFGNTGRPNKRPWINMTYDTLYRGGVDHLFKEIFFRPHGVTGTKGKGAAILSLLEQGYDKVRHTDDDPVVIYSLASFFDQKHYPNVSFVLKQDLSAGILMSRRLAKQYPNVSYIAELSYNHQPKR